MPKAPVYDSRLRSLPSVDRLAAALDAPHALAVIAARRAIDARRQELSTHAVPEPDDLVDRARAASDRPASGRSARAQAPIILRTIAVSISAAFATSRRELARRDDTLYSVETLCCVVGGSDGDEVLSGRFSSNWDLLRGTSGSEAREREPRCEHGGHAVEL
jgi:hypothetical protein